MVYLIIYVMKSFFLKTVTYLQRLSWDPTILSLSLFSWLFCYFYSVVLFDPIVSSLFIFLFFQGLNFKDRVIKERFLQYHRRKCLSWRIARLVLLRKFKAGKWCVLNIIHLRLQILSRLHLDSIMQYLQRLINMNEIL